MTARCVREWCLGFSAFVIVASQPAASGAGTLEEDRALLVKWLTGERVARENASFMDRYVGEEIVVDGLRETAIWFEEEFDGVAYELYGDKIKDSVKIRSFGSAESEDLPMRMLENIGLSTYGVRTFSVDSESGSILMREWYPTPTIRNSFEEDPPPEGNRHINAGGLTEYEGCATRFRRQGDEFIGVPAEGPCTFNITGPNVGIERRWQVSEGAFDLNILYRRLDSQDVASVRPSALFRCDHFELRLTNLSYRAVGFVRDSVEYIHDQNGSVTFGPVTSLDGTPHQDVAGTKSPIFEVGLDRELDARVITGKRRWDDGTTEKAFEVRIPLDATEFAVELANARLELRTARPRFSDLDEVARLFPGTYSNLAQVDGDSRREMVLHVQPIWTHREGHRWFYVEMAKGASQDEPILQRVVEMGFGRDPWTVEWLIHKLEDPESEVGLWRDPDSVEFETDRSLFAEPPCERQFEKHGESWLSSPNRSCVPDPVETFTWLLSPSQIQFNEFTFSQTGDPRIPRQRIVYDRIEGDE